MIHRDHSSEAAAPGGERQGPLTLYPGFVDTDCRFLESDLKTTANALSDADSSPQTSPYLKGSDERAA
jgi:hypothetical protein